MPDAFQVIVNPDTARDTIGPHVRAQAIRNNGENVIGFLSEWEPWRKHLETNCPRSAEMNASFYKLVERYQEQRAVVGSRFHRMSKDDFDTHLQVLQSDLRVSQNELTKQLSIELLFNVRAEYLAERGQLPAYFG